MTDRFDSTGKTYVPSAFFTACKAAEADKAMIERITAAVFADKQSSDNHAARLTTVVTEK